MLSEQQMKNAIKKKAAVLSLGADQLYRLFALEQLLKKINDSPYKDNFIVKGGFLLSTVYGLANRTTWDLDATIRQLTLSREKVEEVAAYLTEVSQNDTKQFDLVSIRPIREQFDYEGFNLKLTFLNGRTRIPIDIDMTTGEKLLPIKETQEIALMFEEGHLELPAYPLEQILADKLYTTLAYGQINDQNTRTKDLYDLYFLTKINPSIALNKVSLAIHQTMAQRQTSIDKNEFVPIIKELSNSSFQQELWTRYARDNSYAATLTYQEIMCHILPFTHQVSEVKLTVKEQLEVAKISAKRQKEAHPREKKQMKEK